MHFLRSLIYNLIKISKYIVNEKIISLLDVCITQILFWLEIKSVKTYITSYDTSEIIEKKIQNKYPNDILNFEVVLKNSLL